MSEQVTNFQFSRKPAAIRNDIETVIGPTLVIRGEVTAEEDLLIMGRVEGRIDHNQTLKIHADGLVKAVVKAKNIEVDGAVEGDVYGTERVNICETGQVVGNVYAPRVGLMEGATFKGMVDMDSDAAAVESRFAAQTSRNRPVPIARDVRPVAVELPKVESPVHAEPVAEPEGTHVDDEANADANASSRKGNRKKGAGRFAGDSSSQTTESDENADDASESASSDE